MRSIACTLATAFDIDSLILFFRPSRPSLHPDPPPSVGSSVRSFACPSLHPPVFRSFVRSFLLSFVSLLYYLHSITQFKKKSDYFDVFYFLVHVIIMPNNYITNQVSFINTNCVTCRPVPVLSVRKNRRI